MQLDSFLTFGRLSCAHLPEMGVVPEIVEVAIVDEIDVPSNVIDVGDIVNGSIEKLSNMNCDRESLKG